MRVRWLAEALRNVDAVAEYIARDDPAAARAVVRRIYDATSLLRDNPGLGRPGRIHGTRELVVPGTRYIVPYRVRPRLNQVEILRVRDEDGKNASHLASVKLQ